MKSAKTTPICAKILDKGNQGDLLMTGKELNASWGVGAVQALFSRTGTWYNRLTKFPGALFDTNGYIKFDSSAQFQEYLQKHAEHIRQTQELNVPGGIDRLPGYIKKL